MHMLRRLIVFALFATSIFACAEVKTLVVISIDGLRPDSVIEAGKHGMKLPNLSKFIQQGAYADGVAGVTPTVTYPSHTTLMTGVWPAEHGIIDNTPFDPFRKNLGGWNWYASQIKVPTLWEAASKAGIVTASLNWPVTVDAKGITYLIPEYWRARTPEDQYLNEALSRPLGWLQELEKTLGPYVDDTGSVIDADTMRTRYAEAILAQKKPGLFTIHFAALDHAQHESAPFSEESNKTLEQLDKLVGDVRAAALKVDPAAVVAVVSDHGFSRTDYRINLMLPFIEAGLVRVSEGRRETRIDSWDAILWDAGGCVAVKLRDPKDAATLQKVDELLKKLQADPKYGIARVLTQLQIRNQGGFPDAAYLIEMKLDYQPGSSLSGPLVQNIPSTGMHGYLPDHTELHSSFFIVGKSIASGRDLGTIDMRQIAPTLADLLNVPMPSATQKPVNVR